MFCLFVKLLSRAFHYKHRPIESISDSAEGQLRSGNLAVATKVTPREIESPKRPRGPQFTYLTQVKDHDGRQKWLAQIDDQGLATLVVLIRQLAVR